MRVTRMGLYFSPKKTLDLKGSVPLADIFKGTDLFIRCGEKLYYLKNISKHSN